MDSKTYFLVCFIAVKLFEKNYIVVVIVFFLLFLHRKSDEFALWDYAFIIF